MTAAVIEDYEFDRIRHRVSGVAYRSADLVHWLALDIAGQALADAGWAEGEGLPRRSTAVYLGNTLTGEFSRAATMRLRWPYVQKVVSAALAERGIGAEERAGLLRDIEDAYKRPFAEVGEETLAGGLSNTIAGRSPIILTSTAADTRLTGRARRRCWRWRRPVGAGGRRLRCGPGRRCGPEPRSIRIDRFCQGRRSGRGMDARLRRPLRGVLAGRGLRLRDADAV